MRQMCKDCVHWDRDGVDPGKMPGVRPGYRKCMLPTLHQKLIRHTHPEGWCQAFVKREQPNEGTEDQSPNLGDIEGTPI